MVAIPVALISVIPIGFLAHRALSNGIDAAWASIVRPRMWMLTTQTLFLIVAVCLAATVLGILSAWIVTRHRLPGRTLWIVALCLPLAIPSFVATFAWRTLFPTLDGFWPLTLVMTLALAPYVTIPTIAAFRRADYAQVDVARTLGRPETHIFWRILLPQILPSSLAGTLIIALYTLSDFGAPAMLRYDTLTTGVYAQLMAGVNPAAPAAAALCIALLSAIIVLGESRLRRQHHRLNSTGYSQALPPSTPQKTALLTGFLTLTTLAGIVVPLGTLLHRSLTNARYDTDWVRLAHAGLTTLGLGLVAATLATIAGLPLAYLGARMKTRFIALLEAATFTGHALPGVVLALAIVSLTLTVAPFAYQGYSALILTYALLFLPKGVGASRAGFASVPPQLEDTAQTLGDTPRQAWFKVSVRGSFGHIVTGWLFVTTAVMKELPATLMLRPTGTNTLATELWNSSSLGAYGASAPTALALVALGLIPTLMLTRNLTRS